MTNLVEKLLITGFGIFVLMSFFFIIAPLTNIIYDYDDYQEDLDKILININDIDQSIYYISIYHNSSIFKEVEISNDLNVSIGEYQIEYSFILNQDNKRITTNHNIKLNNKNYELLSNSSYLLSIFYDLYEIDINFILMG
ncbi:MAG: hypothetical protein KGD63_10125 [Candidatus Lokiarchaeota archaeon]|nr:hypothetical protein [Candidatus Lokiarchaeota archaeon]